MGIIRFVSFRGLFHCFRMNGLRSERAPLLEAERAVSLFLFSSWPICTVPFIGAHLQLLLLQQFGHTQTIFVFCQLILCWIVKNTLFSTASAIIIIIISYCTVWNFFFFICFSACISVSVLLCSVKCKLCSVENVVGLGVFIIFDMFRFFPFLFEGWMRLKLV